MGFLGIVLVHVMCDLQSVARFRYAHVEGYFLNKRLASTRTKEAIFPVTTHTNVSLFSSETVTATEIS